MTLDFPNTPVVGQVHTEASISWVWDGEKWETGPTGTIGGYLPLSGGTLTGAVSAPQYYLDGVLFASSDANYHYVYDKGGATAALVLGGTGTGNQNFYRGDTQTFQSNNAGATFGVFDATGLTVPVTINTNQYKLAGVSLATRGSNTHTIYDFDGQPALILYGTAGSQTSYYRADYHVFQTNDGSPIITLAPGGLTLTGAISATSLTVSGTITGGALVSNGGLSIAGNANVAGTVQAQQLTSNGNINAAGNVNAINLNASSTVNANTVAATGTVSGSLVTANSISSNNTVNAAQFNLRGAPFAVMDPGATQTVIYDPTGAANIIMYASGTNYYQNDIHQFQSRGATTTYAIFNPGGSYNQTGGWGVISDDTVKQNVAPYTAGLAQVKQLNPVSFEYTPAALLRAAGGTNYGLMASEVLPVVPEMVSEAELEIEGVPSPVQALLPTHLVYLLINAVKELSARVEQLEAAR
jgi:Chaperone of endosialidase